MTIVLISELQPIGFNVMTIVLISELQPIGYCEDNSSTIRVTAYWLSEDNSSNIRVTAYWLM